jgi:hypothetical protein
MEYANSADQIAHMSLARCKLCAEQHDGASGSGFRVTATPGTDENMGIHRLDLREAWDCRVDPKLEAEGPEHILRWTSGERRASV